MAKISVFSEISKCFVGIFHRNNYSSTYDNLPTPNERRALFTQYLSDAHGINKS